MKTLFLFLLFIIFSGVGLHAMQGGGIRGGSERGSGSGEVIGKGAVNEREIIQAREENQGNQSDSQERGKSFPQVREEDQLDVDTQITDAKARLEENRSNLEELIQQGSDFSDDLLELQELIKEKHEDFRLQEASSLQHAQYQAQENAKFFSQKAQELEQSMEGKEGEQLWIRNEESSKQALVLAFREKLKQIQPRLIERQKLYEQLSQAYDEKLRMGGEDEGTRNVYSSIDSLEKINDASKMDISRKTISTASASAIEETSNPHEESPQAPERITYHFNSSSNLWTQRTPEGEEGEALTYDQLNPWKDVLGPEERKDLADRVISVHFPQNANRANLISRKRDHYTQELRSLPENSPRYEMITTILPLLDRAIDYQNQMAAALESKIQQSAVEKGKPEGGKALHAELALKLNNHPNKIEQVIEHIEKDYQSLESVQTRLDAVNAQIQTFTNPQAIPYALTRARENLSQSIHTYRNDLILSRIALANLIEPSYGQPMDPVAAETLRAQKIVVFRNQAIAQRFYIQGLLSYREVNHLPDNAKFLNYLRDSSHSLDAAIVETNTPNPRERVIELHLQAADCFFQAARALENTNDPHRMQRAEYLICAGDAIKRAAEEAAKPNPIERVIELRLQAADCLFQAARALENTNDPHREQRAEYLFYASCKFDSAADLECKPDPEERKKYIDVYIHAAECWQEAARTRGTSRIYDLFRTATVYWDHATMNIESGSPREEYINLQVRAAEYCLRGVRAFQNTEDPYREDRSNLFLEAAYELSDGYPQRAEKLIRRAELPNPKEEVEERREPPSNSSSPSSCIVS